MSDEVDLSSTIEEAATSPLKVTTDGTTVEARPMKDLIEADQHLAKKTAGKSKRLGLRFRRQIPPGAV